MTRESNEMDGQHMTETATEAKSTEKPAEAFIAALDDQADHWQHASAERSLDDALRIVQIDAEADGERRDVRIEKLNEHFFVVRAEGDAAVPMLVTPDKQTAIPLRDTAFAHLCERAKAPPGYLRSVPVRYAVPLLNWGLAHRASGDATIRFAGDEARAVLSARYRTTLDDQHAIPALRDGLAAVGLLDSTIVLSVATGLTTNVRMTMPADVIAIPGTGEVIQLSLDLTNGEVGNRACSLAAGALLRNDKLTARRVTLRIPHLGEGESLEARFRAGIPEALAEASKLREQIVKVVDKAIRDVAEEADRLRSLGLSVPEARDVLRSLAASAGVDLPHDTAEWEGPIAEIQGVTAFGVFRAIAGLGEGRAVDRRLDLEEIAAKYLARAAK